MFYKCKELNNFKLNTKDGEIGRVKDGYFDDRFWTIRYLVADTGTWLKNRKVLISPLALLNIDTTLRRINMDLTKKQIENSPSIDTDIPVSRQYETAYFEYYGWPGYWYGDYRWGDYYYLPSKSERQYIARARGWDPNLRSTQEVTGYFVSAIDGELGHVDDYLIEDKTWAIRYAVIDTGEWLPGKKVIISTDWIKSISWPSHQIFVDIRREAIKKAPPFTGDTVITRSYENDVYSHYGLESYWVKMHKVNMKV